MVRRNLHCVVLVGDELAVKLNQGKLKAHTGKTMKQITSKIAKRALEGFSTQDPGPEK